ncbi:hypothetical protein N9N13_04440 [Opitutales bacterium]|jgi:hypothetical protein|nr:hypothetical protein [Opitutales bacterium]
MSLDKSAEEILLNPDIKSFEKDKNSGSVQVLQQEGDLKSKVFAGDNKVIIFKIYFFFYLKQGKKIKKWVNFFRSGLRQTRNAFFSVI